MSHPRGNITDKPFRFERGKTECHTAIERKNNDSSVFLDLRGSDFQGFIRVSVIGVQNNCDTNRTNRGQYFEVCANRKYMLFNRAHEDRNQNCDLFAKLKFIKKSDDIVCGVWSPDSVPDSQCEILRQGISDDTPNVKDEHFKFTGSSFNTNFRRKNNNTKVYLNLCESSFPDSIQVVIFGKMDGNEENCTKDCDHFDVEAGKKYFLENKVNPNFNEAKLCFSCDGNKTVKGKWSPDSFNESGCIILPNTEAPQPVQRVQKSLAKKLIDVPYINQNEIVSGCEAVSAVMLLQYYQYNITPRQFVDNYLVKKPWHQSNGVIYGPDPNSAFPGDPYKSGGNNCGYGCYAPCIASSINKVTGSSRQALVKTGISISDLCHTFVDSNNPVLIWATINMIPSAPSVQWKIDYVDCNSKYQMGSMFQWIKHEHCLVLVGYNDQNYFFNDPYNNNGVVGYPRNIVESRYRELGSQAVVLGEKKKSPEEIALLLGEEMAPKIFQSLIGQKVSEKTPKIKFNSMLIEGYFQYEGAFHFNHEAKSNIVIEGGKLKIENIAKNIPFISEAKLTIGEDEISTKVKLPNGSSFGFDIPDDPKAKLIKTKIGIISKEIGDGKIEVKFEEGNFKFEISKYAVVEGMKFEMKYILAFHFKLPSPGNLLNQAFGFLNSFAYEFQKAVVQVPAVIVEMIVFVGLLLVSVYVGGAVDMEYLRYAII